MATKLSFVNPVPANKVGWHQRSPNAPYSIGDANDIVDVNNVFSQKALAAIPSPLARIHIFETAFEFVTKQANFNGFAVFHKMVADVIDVWEFLFNYNSHTTAGVPISIKTWDGTNELIQLNQSPERNHQHIGIVLEQYLSDNRFQDMNNRFDLLYVNNELVAGTSPLTGFFTAIDPGAISGIPVPRSRTGRHYFDGTAVNVADRDPEFVKYLYTVFGDFDYRTNFPAIYRYLDIIFNNQNLWADRNLRNEVYQIVNAAPRPSPASLYDRIITDTNSDLTICGLPFYCSRDNAENGLTSPLLLDVKRANKPDYISKIPLIMKDRHTWQGIYDSTLLLNRVTINGDINQRILPGAGMKYPFLYIDDFFEDVILSVPYEVDEKQFEIAISDEEHSRSYLLPLKPLFFDMFPLELLSRMIESELLTDGVKITIRIPVENGQTVQYTKSYVVNPQLEGYGKIESVLFDIAFFPFYRVNSPVDDHYLNCDHRIHFTYNTRIGFTPEFKLGFFDKTNCEIHVHEELYDDHRQAFSMNRVTGSDGVHSDIYAVKKDFRFMKLYAGSKGNYVIPKFTKVSLGYLEFDVAVDFGTTNTHVALAVNRPGDNEPQKFIISDSEIQTVTFSKVKEVSGATLSENFSRDTTSNLFAKQSITHQFIPPIVGAGQDPHYEFPTRTVVAYASHRDVYPIFTANVAFFHNKDTERKDESVAANIKWELSGNISAQRLTSAFLLQLLMMIKHKIVLNGGDPSKTRLIWFLPLSLDKPSIAFFKGEWERILDLVFPNVQIATQQITESEAPYYFFEEQNKIFGEGNTISIDIGGGSTDVSFFSDRKPVFFTSFNFAGNTLWKNGYAHSESISKLALHYGEYRNNPALLSDLANKPQLHMMYNAAVKDMKPNSPVELMNFYFAWDKYIKFTQNFQKDDKIKFLFLFHYSAVLFHIYRMCRLQELEFPRHICHSGNGSKILHALDASREKETLKNYVILFLSKIDPDYQVHNNFRNITFNVSSKEKALTCEGGIYYLRNANIAKSVSRKSKFMLYPERFITDEDVCKIESVSNEVQSKIVEEVKYFLKVFTDVVGTLNVNREFGINIEHIKLCLGTPEINIFEESKELYENILKALQKGLNDKKVHSGNDNQLTESPFFFPLVQMIFELSNELYATNNQQFQ